MVDLPYISNFLDDVIAKTAFTALIEDLDWEHRVTARREYWTNIFGQAYTYGSGLGKRTYQSRPSHPTINLITDSLEALFGFRYEGCFLNRYDDARDALGWHADDDVSINHTRPIAVVTLGSPRMIQVKPRESLFISTEPVFDAPATELQSWMLQPGSLFVMPAGMQQTHLHRIPKASRAVCARISLTYRSIFRNPS